MAITKDKLRSRVEMLNMMLGRPTTYFAPTESEAKVNIGFLNLEYNGDYPKSYQLTEVVSAAGGEANWGQRCNASEMSIYLDGIFHGLTLQIIKQKKDEKPKLTLKEVWLAIGGNPDPVIIDSLTKEQALWAVKAVGEAEAEMYKQLYGNKK